MKNPQKLSELLPNPESLPKQIQTKSEDSQSSNCKINGCPDTMTPEEIERFWKMGLVQSMNSVSPGFVIDERNQKLISEIYLWVWAWMGRKERGKLDPNKGLLLWGDIGTGKTTIIKGLQKYLAAINELAYGCNNRSICFEIKSAAEISLRYSADGMKAMERWTEREQAGHLAIDEIGRESVSNHFGTPCNTIQTILQLRYELRHRIITHATTNIDMFGTEFSERYGTYIYDRLKEMFNIIHVGGKSRRI